MRKAMCVIVMCLLVCASMAWANEDIGRTPMPAVGVSHAAPTLRDDCSLSYFDWNDPNIDWSYWSCTAVTDGFKQYYDVATDQYPGTVCNPAYYPFQVQAISIYLYVRTNCDTGGGSVPPDSFNVIGKKIIFAVDIECAKDVASPGIPEQCKGPGEILAQQVYEYTFTQEDWDNYAVALTLPIEVCVAGPFFASYRGISWEGDPYRAPAPLWNASMAIPAGSSYCSCWSYLDLGLGYCWFANDYDFGCGTSCWPGDYLLIVDGQSNTTCTPELCYPCPRVLPGETDANPVVVSGTSWSADFNLCDYCSDYNACIEGITPMPTGTRCFTGQAGDMVLKIEFPDPNEFYSFIVTITPDCQGYPYTHNRVRSWMKTGGAFYYADNPTWPTFGQAQVYQMDDNVGGFGSVMGGVYLLYIDHGQCCCPIHVSYTGDFSLPVEMTAFDVVAGDRSATVTWRTASETDNDYFQIARDGAVVGTVDANNGASGHEYTWTNDGLDNGVTYSYTLSSVSLSGEVKALGTKSVTPTFDAAVVTDYALHQNFPNPFNPTTAIAFDLKDAGFVSLTVYNLMGQSVGTVAKGDMAAGRHIVSFDGSNLASGVYLYRLEVNGFAAEKKMVLMK